MRTRSGCGMPPSCVSARRAARRRPRRPPRARGAARAGATRERGRCAGGRRSGRGRSGRARARSACSASRMPPLRRVRSCSPSASARTVTAHSLKAIGIGREGERTVRQDKTAASRQAARRGRGSAAFYAEKLPNPKPSCKSAALERFVTLSRSTRSGDAASNASMTRREVVVAVPALQRSRRARRAQRRGAERRPGAWPPRGRGARP